jgi:hypothetical protein
VMDGEMGGEYRERLGRESRGMSSRMIRAFLFGVVQLFLFAVLTRAEEGGFSDDFSRLNVDFWDVSSHALGRGWLEPSNVGVEDGKLVVVLPARTLDGGEISTKGLYGYGTYSARIRVPDAPGSITGFFLYKSPDYQSEIDVEIYNDSSRRILFTTYAGGAQTNTRQVRLPFDPTEGFHEYSFRFAPDSITFYTDGELLQRFEDGLPQNTMHLMINAWFPRWLKGRQPRHDARLYVDYVSYVPGEQPGPFFRR